MNTITHDHAVGCDRADVVIIQQYPLPYFGVLTIDAHLRKAGYRLEVLIDAFESDIIGALTALNPKLIGFSVFSTEHQWLVRMTQKIQAALPAIPIIVGGVHAMVYSEQILCDTATNFVCRADGEYVVVAVLQELARGGQPDFAKIAGLSFRSARGDIVHGPQASRLAFDNHVLEQRDVYLKRYPALSQDSIGYFISGRGCPYACSFCYNSYLREAIGAAGYVQRKDPENFIQELECAIEKIKVKSVFFIDDLFTFDKKWLREFLPKYHKRIHLPFVCMTRANVMDEETARMLSESGCHSVSFGIETGNQELRRTVLNKKITDAEMIRCGTLIHQYGMTVRASNMFCLPDETVADALRTIELNIQSRVDLAASMLLIPYPQTGITEYMKARGMIAPDYSLADVPIVSYHNSVLDIPHKAAIKNVHFLSYFFVKYPWFFRRFQRIVSWTWLSPLYYFLFMYSLVERNKRENQLTWIQTFCYAWRKKSLLKKAAAG